MKTFALGLFLVFLNPSISLAEENNSSSSISSSEAETQEVSPGETSEEEISEEETDDGQTEVTVGDETEVSSTTTSAQQGRERAMVLYRVAWLRYREGRFEEAVELLREALENHDSPELYFNLGNSLQELERWSEAREAYQAFLERSEDISLCSEAAARIERLDRRIAEATTAGDAHDEVEVVTASARATDDIEPASVHERPRIRPWPWVILGSGALVLGAGLVCGVLYFRDVNAAQDSMTAQRLALQAYERSQSFGIATSVTLSVGGVIALVGLVWGIIDAIRVRGERRSSITSLRSTTISIY